ncbi:putative DNA methyltransferase YeeA [Desulfuromonas soudanensis]|uniref:site-specific DNA-methyltransferase (adenine-specific) n=1 Tax=Desulfuromonas soudanensis TaxID=1603606 RepID=A0A0M5IVH8_9BACT|nr:DNA methyltransferase [Desulfuromonas soudanensis]ALC15724.1 putative DNA methyltransferase YeeA [Desulfuromonas soudanensis]
MTVREFIAKWKASTLKERSASQEHFIDLCRLLAHKTPAEADPTGEHFTFERGASKTGGGEGWADVWKKGFFAWEYKGKHKDLIAAFAQLQRYAIALENPPLLVVSDMETIVIHTNFTNTVQEIHTLALEDLEKPEALQKLRWLLTEPERFRPGITRHMVTERAAQTFAELAQTLRSAGHTSHSVAHFVNKLIFCMFAEDSGLLPGHLFTRMVESIQSRPAQFADRARLLFAAMRHGGEIGFGDVVPWFNGGLFDDDDALPLDAVSVAQLLACAKLDWSDIEPAIFGTLFERGLDPAKRSQLGAHYTDRDSILRIVGPVVIEPLEREWSASKIEISSLLDKGTAPARKKAEGCYRAFLTKLRAMRVLDPACGSGNFLYLSLVELKNLEHRLMLEGEIFGFQRDFHQIGPHNVLGIEINDYAAELARVTVWIGDIQWNMKNGVGYSTDPILKKLDGIACRDALLTRAPSPQPSPARGEGAIQPEALTMDADASPPTSPLNELHGTQAPHGPQAPPPFMGGSVAQAPPPFMGGGWGEGSLWLEAAWPEADCIVGNPPFLGDKKMLAELGEDYVTRLRSRYKGRVPGGADLVTYWFEKARAEVEAGRVQRAGLVATNSIRGGASRRVLERICASGRIFNAWSDEPWINEGAAVRVSLICFAGNGLAESECKSARLDSKPVSAIYADLTGPAERAGFEPGPTCDLTTATALKENESVAFQGPTKGGAFDIPGELARQWLHQPNPHGKSNSEVIKPWANGQAITGRWPDMWIIDFAEWSEDQATLFEAPFAHVLVNIKPDRKFSPEKGMRERYWLFKRSGADMRLAISGLSRYIATPEVAKHRVFVWCPASIASDKNLVVIARNDDTTFGILQSRIHELWALRMGTSLEDRPRYTSSTTFRTFPFPTGLTPNLPASSYAGTPQAEAIATAAQRLVELRDNWLNPPEWVERLPEVVAGYPDRILPKPGCEKDLAKRTLTNLYNLRPQWLQNAHATLDAAVAAAYGWPADLADDEVLGRLLALNRERSG